MGAVVTLLHRRRCENCKHWEPMTKPDQWTENLFKEGWGKCQHPNFIYGHPTELVDIDLDSLVYWDWESYKAAFATGKNFGCVHWGAGKWINE